MGFYDDEEEDDIFKRNDDDYYDPNEDNIGWGGSLFPEPEEPFKPIYGNEFFEKPFTEETGDDWVWNENFD